MEGLGMTEKEQAAIMIDIYTDLQRIQKAEDRDKELMLLHRKSDRNIEFYGFIKPYVVTCNSLY